MSEDFKENALQFSIANVDETRRLVFGQVYQPNKIDAKGWFMEPEEVEKMAHRYMRHANLKDTIDTNHDNIPNGCYPVQSFIARESDTEYAPGSWVLAVKVTNDELWSKIVEGEINAFSMEIYVRRIPATVTYEITPNQVGSTETAEDHTHYFYAQLDETGRVVGGKTSVNAGHSHEIQLNSVTETTNGHAHRFFVGLK
jgi:hypothetical protein